MTKEEFKAMDPMLQVKYINNKLNAGITFLAICEKINIPKSTLRDHLKRIGYIKDEQLKIWVPIEDYQSSGQVVDKKEVAAIAKDKPDDYSSNGQVVTSENYASILKVVVGLENTIKDMDKRLNTVHEWYELQRNVIEPIELKIANLDDDTVTRSFKIKKNVQDRFVKFCSNNKQYKVGDILSQALCEFMDRYE